VELLAAIVGAGEKAIEGSWGSLEPPGPRLTHLHTVYMAYSECLPTRLSPLAERTCFKRCFSQVGAHISEPERVSRVLNEPRIESTGHLGGSAGWTSRSGPR
jgi:hypothetical protein